MKKSILNFLIRRLVSLFYLLAVKLNLNDKRSTNSTRNNINVNNNYSSSYDNNDYTDGYQSSDSGASYSSHSFYSSSSLTTKKPNRIGIIGKRKLSTTATTTFHHSTSSTPTSSTTSYRNSFSYESLSDDSSLSNNEENNKKCNNSPFLLDSGEMNKFKAKKNKLIKLPFSSHSITSSLSFSSLESTSKQKNYQKPHKSPIGVYNSNKNKITNNYKPESAKLSKFQKCFNQKLLRFFKCRAIFFFVFLIVSYICLNNYLIIFVYFKNNDNSHSFVVNDNSKFSIAYKDVSSVDLGDPVTEEVGISNKRVNATQISYFDSFFSLISFRSILNYLSSISLRDSKSNSLSAPSFSSSSSLIFSSEKRLISSASLNFIEILNLKKNVTEYYYSDNEDLNEPENSLVSVNNFKKGNSDQDKNDEEENSIRNREIRKQKLRVRNEPTVAVLLDPQDLEVIGVNPYDFSKFYGPYVSVINESYFDEEDHLGIHSSSSSSNESGLDNQNFLVNSRNASSSEAKLLVKLQMQHKKLKPSSSSSSKYRRPCIHPKLNPFNKEIMKFVKPEYNLKCNPKQNWIYVENGTLRVSKQAIRKHGPIVCAYIPLYRGNNDFTVYEGNRIYPVMDKMPLITDFFKIDCRSKDGAIYSNIHSGIAYESSLHMRHIWNPLPQQALGYNVLMIGFDSVSRMSWIRMLPKTYEYMLKEGFIVLKGYNIVGDGTPQALLPILTGKKETELPEARRGFVNATYVDGFPWIWKAFKNAGYVTQWAEDMQSIGTFQLRMLGFRKQPVDHYMRLFYLEAEKYYSRFRRLCLGSISRHMNMFNWVKEFFTIYEDKPKFSFIFHSEASHNYNNPLSLLDDDLRDFLKHLKESGSLANTILFLMSDHGVRVSDLRQYSQGKLEEVILKKNLFSSFLLINDSIF